MKSIAERALKEMAYWIIGNCNNCPFVDTPKCVDTFTEEADMLDKKCIKAIIAYFKSKAKKERKNGKKT